ASAPGQLVDVLIAQGIAAAESDAVFDRLFNAEAASMVVSPTAMADVAREMARIGAKRRPRNDDAAAGDKTATATYANKVEEKIAQFWSELLGVRQPDPDADFFDLGGHSLAAVRLFAKIRKEYATDLPLATLFQAPTLRLLAKM